MAEGSRYLTRQPQLSTVTYLAAGLEMGPIGTVWTGLV